MDPSKRTILREVMGLISNPPVGISEIDYDYHENALTCELAGPDKTPYDGGVFKLRILGCNYPNSSPTVIMTTKIYHPNIDQNGRICINILGEGWSPLIDLRTILGAIYGLLSNPNPKDPLMADVGMAWIKDEEKAIETAKVWTQKYASKST